MHFETLDIWKLSSALSAKVYQELRDLRDYSFKDQITGSCLSIPSNIAEGIERHIDKDTYRFLSMAKGSLAEFKTQTYIDMKIGYITKGQACIAEAEKIAAMLAKFMQKFEATDI
jgi:four helix bundle protein